MLKKLLLASYLFVSINIQAQTADVRVGQLVNESNWFGLEQTLKTTPANSISPFLRQLATAMTHHYFNRPDSACTVLADLLSNHQQELGDYTMNMVILYSVNLARIGCKKRSRLLQQKRRCCYSSDVAKLMFSS